MRPGVLCLLLVTPCFGLSCEDGSCMRSDDSALSSVELLQHSLGLTSTLNEQKAEGSSWNRRDALVIMAKIHEVVVNWIGYYRMLSKYECYAEGPTSNATHPTTVPCQFYTTKNGPVTRGANPSWPKLLRLGFHDCMRYTDGSGGCDGCLNFENMFLRFIKPIRRGQRVRPTHPAGHNANLAVMGDVLEMIYTDPKFPRHTPVYGQSAEHPDGLSMRDSGKSRADLWAFATIVAIQQGFRKNNEKCLQNETYYNTLGASARSCRIQLQRDIQFRSGRVDCSADDKPAPWQCAESCKKLEEDKRVFPNCRENFLSCIHYSSCDRSECRGCDYCQPAIDGSHKPRPYETTKSELAPNPDFGSEQLADFFQKELGFSKRETVTIMGAHSFGHFNGELDGGYRYDWVHKQTDVLNNVYYTLLTLQPGKNFENGRMFDTGSRRWVFINAASVGGVNGSMAKTRFSLGQDDRELGGGHFQWSHQYLRCPFCVDGVNLDRHQNIWGTPKDRCCDLCSKATKAELVKEGPRPWRIFEYKLEGLTDDEKDEFTSHRCFQWVAVHEMELTVDLALHKKMRTEPRGWPLDSKGHRMRGILPTDYELNDLKDDDDDMNMHEIVELYAREGNTWANAFVQTAEKMLETGRNGPLTLDFELGLDVSCAMNKTEDNKWLWSCDRGPATCWGYRCPVGFSARPSLHSIRCESTFQELGESVCSPQECCVVSDQ